MSRGSPSSPTTSRPPCRTPCCTQDRHTFASIRARSALSARHNPAEDRRYVLTRRQSRRNAIERWNHASLTDREASSSIWNASRASTCPLSLSPLFLNGLVPSPFITEEHAFLYILSIFFYISFFYSLSLSHTHTHCLFSPATYLEWKQTFVSFSSLPVSLNRNRRSRVWHAHWRWVNNENWPHQSGSSAPWNRALVFKRSRARNDSVPLPVRIRVNHCRCLTTRGQLVPFRDETFYLAVRAFCPCCCRCRCKWSISRRCRIAISPACALSAHSLSLFPVKSPRRRVRRIGSARRHTRQSLISPVLATLQRGDSLGASFSA